MEMEVLERKMEESTDFIYTITCITVVHLRICWKAAQIYLLRAGMIFFPPHFRMHDTAQWV